jgi:hypothetical protein
MIRNLPNTVRGIKPIESEKTVALFLEPCRTCAAARLQRIISRRPFSPVTRPYEQVHINLIVMTMAYNGAKYTVFILAINFKNTSVEASKNLWPVT